MATLFEFWYLATVSSVMISNTQASVAVIGSQQYSQIELQRVWKNFEPWATLIWNKLVVSVQEWCDVISGV